MKNKIKTVGIAAFSALLFAACSTETTTQMANVDYVNPFIGSGDHGHVFVGACVPFGAVQVGPQNFHKGWDWCSGYHYSDSIVVGFTQTHLSGTGCSDLSDVALMPYTGDLRTSLGTQENIEGATSAYYKHEDETCKPGYYSVKLSNGVDVELTATKRVGFHHYTFNNEGVRRVLIDLSEGNGTDIYESAIRKVDDNTIEGYRYSYGWAEKRKVFFVAKFSEPLDVFNTFEVDEPADTDDIKGVRVKGVCTFKSDINEVYAKVAISSVSIENAHLNLNQELAGWDFNAVKDNAYAEWEKTLSVIDVEGTDKQKTIFYTALYHTFIAPNLYQDVNGEYRGIDEKIYKSEQENYTTFSLWDTYRQLHPMYTVLIPERVPAFINSMLSIYDQNGKLPIWPLWNEETNCMPGYSSVPVIADAYLKGIQGFDAERALNYMISTSTNPDQKGVKLFMDYGYIPADKLGEATSIQLEYAADDMGTALMAKAMGKDDVYQTYLERALSYQKLWDANIMKIHPKMADGSWFEPYDPFLANHRDGVGDFCEGNGWHYTFMVPQDPDGLVKTQGGDIKFVENLDSLFVVEGDLGEGAPPDVSGLIGQYAHGNEPVHHVPYLYVYAGAQWKAAEKIRMVQETMYTDQPEGYCGNEDCGQMSAWHVMSALGMYQVTPSDGKFAFGSPLFKKATINLSNGNKFVISSPKNSDKNIYIKSAKFNGENYTKSYITYEDIMNGGTLEFEMSDTPNKDFGTAEADRPTAAK